MLRLTVLFLLGGLLACSEQPRAAHQRRTEASPPAAPAPTADALAARQVAQRYFDLLGAGDYAAALSLWSPDSGTAAGGLKAFAEASRAQGHLKGRAGLPSTIRDADAMRYVLVETGAHLVSPKGRASELSGVLMLKRPARAGSAWRIWGTDIRPRRCKAGQVARGLGCVPA